MATNKIEKTIHISASKENVWRVLTEDFFNRQWYAEFSQGTYAKGDLQEGGKLIFLDATNSGMITKVVTLQPQQELIYEYTGILKDGQEDYESAEAKAVQGGREAYQLKENNGLTELQVTGDMAPEYIEMMSASWNRAAEKIRMLAEMLQIQ